MRHGVLTTAQLREVDPFVIDPDEETAEVVPVDGAVEAGPTEPGGEARPSSH